MIDDNHILVGIVVMSNGIGHILQNRLEHSNKLLLICLSGLLLLLLLLSSSIPSACLLLLLLFIHIRCLIQLLIHHILFLFHSFLLLPNLALLFLLQ